MLGSVQRNIFRSPAAEADSLLSEDEFSVALSLERKRTERSGNAFLLALFSASHIKQGEGPLISLRNVVVPAIRPVLRETDVLGWYRFNDMVGVVFTNCHGESKVNTRNAIDRKLRSVLASVAPEGSLATLDISYHFFPDDSEQLTTVLPPTYAQNHAPSGNRGAGSFKRAIDIVGSLLVMPLLLPLFAIIGILIKLNSRGPVVFCQTRVGKYGKPFSFLKFRSMYDKNDPTIHREYVARLIAGKGVAATDGENRQVFKIIEDPRVTGIGRILRKTSLDELPQFFNVLKGDMSLVGPRPPLPYEFERYETWHRQRVMQVKPGITGLWQVSGRCRTTFDEMVRLDLRYARTWSIGMDLKILLRTPGAVWSGEGAC